MKLFVHTSKVLAVHMRVDLGRRDVRVSEHFLNRSKVRAALQQVRRERMPERMRGDVLGQTGLVDVMAQNLPCPHARQRRAAGIQKQDASALAAVEFWPQLAQVDRDGADGAPADRNESFLAPLSEDTHQT